MDNLSSKKHNATREITTGELPRPVKTMAHGRSFSGRVSDDALCVAGRIPQSVPSTVTIRADRPGHFLKSPALPGDISRLRSGANHAKLLRRNFSESLDNVASADELRGTAGNFLNYARPLTANNLPVDAHEQLTLCAPRHVFIGGGTTQGDGWVNARSMLMAAVTTSPVFEFLGKKCLIPSMEIPPTAEDIAFASTAAGVRGPLARPYF